MNQQANVLNNSEFTQPLSSYLTGLPELVVKKGQGDANLKLLAYWEKKLIPKLIEFVKNTYKPWEMNMYFEQVRYHLKEGRPKEALKDALVMWENRIPAGAQIPDDNHDWSAKASEEAIVGSWALAKLKRISHLTKGAGGQLTNHPLLNKLIGMGIEEIAVKVKCVDFRSQAVLAEFMDTDSAQT